MGQANSSQRRQTFELMPGAKFAILGQYDVGKTTLMQKLTGNKDAKWTYTMYSTDNQENLIFRSWGTGGRSQSRPLYEHLQRFVDGVIYVINSQQEPEDGIVDNYDLQDMLSSGDVGNVPVLIVANKQDLPDARTCSQLSQELKLDQISREKQVEILPLSLVTEEGLAEVKDWVEHQQRKKQLHKAIIQPLEKAVPPTVTSAYSRMSSALKRAFGMVRHKFSCAA